MNNSTLNLNIVSIDTLSEEEKLNIRLLIQKKHNLKFFHVLPNIYSSANPNGMTIAYGLVLRDTYWISTALCSPKDTFSKKEGCFYAAVNYEKGFRVMVRKPTHYKRIEDFLHRNFGSF